MGRIFLPIFYVQNERYSGVPRDGKERIAAKLSAVGLQLLRLLAGINNAGPQGLGLSAG